MKFIGLKLVNNFIDKVYFYYKKENGFIYYTFSANREDFMMSGYSQEELKTSKGFISSSRLVKKIFGINEDEIRK